MVKGWLYSWSVGSVAFGTTSLLTPLYVVELGGDAFDLGILAAVAAFVGIPGAVLFGKLADRRGPRREYVLGALGVLAAMVVTIPMIDSITLVIVANGAVWFAFAAAMPVLTMHAVSNASSNSWSERIAQLNKYQGVGWAFGLLLGTVWTGATGLHVDSAEAIRTCFLAAGVLAVVGIVIGVRTIPPTTTGTPPKARRRIAVRRAGRFDIRSVTFPFTVSRADIAGVNPRRFSSRFTPRLAVYFIAVVGIFTGFSAFFAPLPAFLTGVGFDTESIFLLYLISSLSSAITFGTVGRLASVHDVPIIQAAGLFTRGIAFPIVAIIGIVLGAGLSGFVALIVVFSVIGVTWAIITVTAGTIVTALAPVAIRGEALGVYAALTAMAGGIGALLGGTIAAHDFFTSFLVAGTLIVVGALMVARLRGRVTSGGASWPDTPG